MSFLYPLKERLISNARATNVIFFTVVLSTILITSFVHKKESNNFKIFRSSLKHTVEQTNLYDDYPEEHGDRFYYGILFSYLVVPFYAFPVRVGSALFNICSVLLLYFAIRNFPTSIRNQNTVLFFILVDLCFMISATQTSGFVAATFLFAYIFIMRNKEIHTAFIVLMSTFVKIYGILGFGLFFLVKKRFKFIAYTVLIGALLFFAPSIISSISFNMQSYLDWFSALQEKNSWNLDIDNHSQNISLLGMCVKISRDIFFPTHIIFMMGCLIQTLVILKSYFHKTQSQYAINLLTSLMLFVVLFSTGTENSSYIIASTCVAIWCPEQPFRKSTGMVLLMVFVFVVGSLSIPDIVPEYWYDNFVGKYSIKALPYATVWCVCVYNMLREEMNLTPIEQRRYRL